MPPDMDVDMGGAQDKSSMNLGDAFSTDCDYVNHLNQTAAAGAGDMNASAVAAVAATATATDSHQPQLDLYGRPMALRRQPTKYPHGLSISVQTITAEEHYSRASTLRSNWDDASRAGSHDETSGGQRKYRISMISSPENLAELQVRRLKYPLTGNYYLDTQETGKSPLLLLQQAQRFCRWKYLRWPIIFLACVLLFFGLITYCIWLHDVSVARDRYLQRRNQLNQLAAAEDDDSSASSATIGHSAEVLDSVEASTEPGEGLESTLLRALGPQSTHQRPKEQKLTTVEYAVSKGVVAWSKETKITASRESTTAATTRVAENSEPKASEVDVDSEPEEEDAVHFTSGHQNSFGVPIEEDERILRLIDGLFPNHKDEPTSTVASHAAKVSPTIPPLIRLHPTSAMSATRTTAQESGCYSTSLPMCRGVLDYDLTSNSTTRLEPAENEAFQQLFNANCSERAVEFVCATLEPECRPSHIGVLPPCRRICKAILEACSIEIANSDVLSALFDCHLYPESNDPHKCEDPTRRRGYCYDNEFECYDRSCIPSQWQCDNIKDCAVGEDEDSCLRCDQQDEFRCRSNEKCVPETVRCDTKYDCFDGSDEEDCDEYGSGEEGAFDEAALNSFPRIFSYASFLSPNQTDEGLYTYITASTDDETGTKFQVHEITNRTSGVSQEDVTNSVPGDGPKGFVNFRDSKEIMMTSDTENKFKYSSSAAARANRTGAKLPPVAATGSATTPLQPAASLRVAVTTEAPRRRPAPTCAPHQLRCVSGKCITVDQLCDKKIDCPDGADEVMCVYKNRTTTTARSSNGSTGGGAGGGSVISTMATTRAADKRTLRTTTIRRKLKTR